MTEDMTTNEIIAALLSMDGLTRDGALAHVAAARLEEHQESYLDRVAERQATHDDQATEIKRLRYLLNEFIGAAGGFDPAASSDEEIETMASAWVRKYEELKARVAELEAERRWRPIDAKAKSGNSVLIHYTTSYGRSRIIKAFYAAQYTLECDEDYAEYCEEKHEYFAKEGWYEMIDNSDDYSFVMVQHKPDFWQPLPKPPEDVK